MCAYPPVSSIFKSQIWLCRFFLCSTKTYWNIFKFVRHHQVVKFVAKSESLLNVHICRLKVESKMFGLWQLFLNLWPKLSDYVVTGRIVVILTRFPYLALGTELGWFIYNQWTLGLKLSVRIFANKLCSQLIFNQSGVLPLASQPARWERTRCRLCSLR